MCKSIDPKYEEQCLSETNSRFCQYCEGSSGLPREKEVKYLELKRRQLNNEMPTHTQRALNLAKAVTSHIFSGCKLSSEEELNRRLRICSECEHYQPARNACSLCGCFLNVKAAWKEQKCPINQW